MSGPTPKRSLQIGHATHEGRRGKNNEDAYGFFEALFPGEAPGLPARVGQVLVVADGIGGKSAGEHASLLAVDTIREIVTSQSESPASQRLNEAILRANLAIYEASVSDPTLKGMGTTVVVAALVGSRLYVAHAGDSRAYLVRDDEIFRLTLDHTWAQEAIDSGRLTEREAAEHPNRNVIKRYLGIQPDVEVDLRVVDVLPAAGREFVEYVVMVPGDRLLLCSDGLSDLVPDRKIRDEVRRHPPQVAADRLVRQANRRGGHDNITIVTLALPGLARAADRRSGRVIALVVAALLLLLLLGGAYRLSSRGEESPASLVPALSAPAAIPSLTPFGPPADGAQAPATVTVTLPPTSTAVPERAPSP